MTSRRPASLGRRLRSVYVWHRWLGVAALVFVLLFAATGLALNHTEALKLDERHIQNAFWLSLYGLNDDVTVRGFQKSGHWFSQAGGRIYFDDRFIGTGPLPVDAVQLKNLWLLAGSNQLWLLDRQAQPLEVIDAAQLPGRVRSLEIRAGKLILHSPYASFLGDLDELDWQTISARQKAAPLQESPPAALARPIVADVRAHALNLERILLDLHSGRLFGKLGVYVMDMAAIVLMVLGLTGLLLWLRYQLSQRRIRERRRLKRQAQ